jgi:hypothetical protein
MLATPFNAGYSKSWYRDCPGRFPIAEPSALRDPGRRVLPAHRPTFAGLRAGIGHTLRIPESP